MNVFTVFAVLLILIIYLIYVITKRKFNYWKKKNVPYVKPVPVLGNYGNHIFLQEYIGKLVQRLCSQFPNAPYFGAFFGTEPVLIVQSPDILKHVFTKDFYYFSGREISNYSTHEDVTANLFFEGGDTWKIKRQILSPMFTSGKMKNMFKLIDICCKTFEKMLDEEINLCDVIESKNICARYTIDCLTSCAFGIEANTMLQPDNNQFSYIANETFNSSNYRGFKLISRSVWPAIFYTLGFKCFPPVIGIFFSKLIKGVFENRNFKPSTRNDFVDLLLNLRNKSVITTDSIKNTKSGVNETAQIDVNDDLLIGQCITLFGAGFETSASALSFTLFELAKNPDAQKRAAAEVDEFLHRRGNKLDYEVLKELPYTEACVYETLRKYPVLGNLTREVMDDYTLPDGLQLDKGIRIHIPVYSMHHNPEYFPEPEVYKPERFLPENKENIQQYTFFPYGEGPRMCVGLRFSKLQMLPGLVTFLKKYQVELTPNMPQNVILDCRTFVTQPRDQGIFLKVSKREGWEQRMFVRP